MIHVEVTESSALGVWVCLISWYVYLVSEGQGVTLAILIYQCGCVPFRLSFTRDGG